MSTLLVKPRATKSGGTTLGATLPQVNLLPPEVRVARGLRTTKRWLGISLVLVVVACAGVYGMSLLSAASAAGELVEAQDETLRLQNEQAKYAEVPQVLGALERTEQGITFGMSTDVEWKPYVDAVAAVLPPNVSIDSLMLTFATPMTAAARTSTRTPRAPERRARRAPARSPAPRQRRWNGRTLSDSTVPDGGRSTARRTVAATISGVIV